MPSTIGKKLKIARLDRNLTLEDVFKSTHIRIKFLEALEADDFSVMPSPVQGRGFLRLYAQYLNLNIDTLLVAPEQYELAVRIVQSDQIQGSANNDTNSVVKGIYKNMFYLHRDISAMPDQ